MAMKRYSAFFKAPALLELHHQIRYAVSVFYSPSWLSQNLIISCLYTGHTSVSQWAKTYIHQLGVDTWCRLEDLLRVMHNRVGWRERFKGILTVKASWVASSSMARETVVQSQVESYQKLKKWYLIPPCLTLSIIRYLPRVEWSNLGKGVAPSSTPWCSSYWKESLQVALNYSHQLYLLTTLDLKTKMKLLVS